MTQYKYAQIYDNKREFNEKVLKLREQKVWLVTKMQEIGRRLTEIRSEIPHKLAKQPPAVPHIDEDLEFPEKNLEVILCRENLERNIYLIFLLSQLYSDIISDHYILMYSNIRSKRCHPLSHDAR